MTANHTEDTPREKIAETMRDTMRLYMPHEPIEPTGGNPLTDAHLIETSKDRTIHDLTKYHREAWEYLKPARRKGIARLIDLESFIAWSNRFKGETSALFVDPDIVAPALTCIADYHAQGPVSLDGNGDPTARHLHHRAIYNFPLSNEWRAWTGISGKMMDKDELGDFIEEHALDIQDPTPAIIKGQINTKNEDWENRLIQTAMKIEGRFGQLAELLSLSKTFQIYETSNLKAVTNRDTGESEIQFLNEHKTPDGKPVKLPNLIIIAIPVFKNGALFRLPVRFRYRKSGPNVGFTLTLYNTERAFDMAIDEAATRAADETGLPLFKGSPEIA